MKMDLSNITNAEKAFLYVGKEAWLKAGMEKRVNDAMDEGALSCAFTPERGQQRLLKDFAEKALGFKVKKKTEKGQIQLTFDWSMSDA
jgi:hypothetical protein